MHSSRRSFTVHVDSDFAAEHVSAFRTALELFGVAELVEFLPPRDHPRYLEVLTELVRLDLIQGWKLGTPTSLETYQARYPDLTANSALLYRLAQEEMQLRRKAGQNSSMADYGSRFDLFLEGGPSARPGTPAEPPFGSRVSALAPEKSSKLDIALPPDDITVCGKTRCLTDSDPMGVTPHDAMNQTHPGFSGGEMARRSSDPEIDVSAFDPTAEMPKVGDEFLDFFLLGELGRGAFGKVFLAQQGHLAGRLVALKVAMGLFSESQTLAQLQHTHIVPIYSYHHGQPYQAVCMPYLGSTTLAHVLSDIRTHNCIPSSGKELLSTLNSRKKRNGHGDTQSRRDSLPAASPQPPDANVESAHAQESVPSAPTALLELEGMTYVDSILWLARRLADGLGHAHERGIIHRDLKPANILITDDGMPMLLDFNLAHDTKQHDRESTSSMGGTLPYMAPEHLRAFQGLGHVVDARSDVYSLGVILFELLTGVSPFAAYKKLPMRDVVERMVLDRKLGAPKLRPLNKNVSPAVEAIVLKCLAPDPAKRYQSAHELQEDLQRHLENRPLKHAADTSLAERWTKFRKRHPRLTSTVSVAAVACVLFAGLASLFLIREEHRNRLAARETLTRFHDDAQTTYFLLNARSVRDQIEEGETACRTALAHYHILENPDWRAAAAVQKLPEEQRQRLEQDAGQLLVLLAHAQQVAGEMESDPARRAARYQAGVHYCSLAGDCFPDERAPRTLWNQQGELFRRLNEREKAEKCFERARQADLANAHDRYLAARLLAEDGKFRDALPLVREAIGLNPQDYHLHFLEGICHDYLGQHAEAMACYRTCIALRPAFFGAYYNRGLSYLRQGAYKAAVAEFDHTVRLKPDFAEAYMQRALAHQGGGKFPEAIADLTAALDRGFGQTRAYLLRAKLREKTRDLAGAKRDLEEGLRREPTDELSWIARGIAYLPGEPKRALSDFERALTLNPRSLAALQNKAHVLGKYFKQTEQAIQVLDKAVQLYPDDPRPRAGRGVFLARLGKREAALKDAEHSLLIDTNAANLYQVAGIYALTSRQQPDDQKEALRLLASALKKGFGFDHMESDRDLDPLRNSATFRRVIEAARAMQTSAATPRR